MKAIKTTSLLLILMIITAIEPLQSGNITTSQPGISAINNIRYEVDVLLFARIELCNTYMVQVMDETGRLVAPAKVYIPGIQKYIFTEAGPAQGKLRVAMLVLTKYSETECQIHLGAPPDVKIGPFYQGQSYPFTLRPILTVPLNQ